MSDLKFQDDPRPILLTIDDPDIDALVAELMALTGEMKEEVLLKALQEKHEHLVANKKPPA